MDIDKLCAQYALHEEDICCLKSCGALKGCGEPSAEELDALSMAVLLKGCGCDLQNIRKYFALADGAGGAGARAAHLKRLRAKLLEEVRLRYAYIDKLDYIIRSLEGI